MAHSRRSRDEAHHQPVPLALVLGNPQRLLCPSPVGFLRLQLTRQFPTSRGRQSLLRSLQASRLSARLRDQPPSRSRKLTAFVRSSAAFSTASLRCASSAGRGALLTGRGVGAFAFGGGG